ncbi:TolB family protein [Spirosoma flavum]|uniref:TolB family protein n=1 Tax=Spirosoma flavum TaxID=2048557 RepID=A0ABW6AL19_9BACT
MPISSHFIRKSINRSSAFYWLALMLPLLPYTVTLGQTPPDADIFLVDLSLKSQPVQVGKPVNSTQRKGYDNQPSFTPDGTGLLYTSMREDGQTDIYKYDLQQKTTTQLTQTPESEYSPTVTPDQAYFSVIRVEKDKTQRLWKFPIAGTGEPTLVLEKVKPVGYHCWLTADWLALFILGTPNSLQLAHVKTGDTTRIEGSIGRCLLKIPGKNALSFVHKRTPTDWEIKQLDLQTLQITSIGRTLTGSEDFVWTPDGTLLMCQGTALYQLNPSRSPDWTQLADFSSVGIKQLTRMAIDPEGKKLALVGQ